MLSILISKYLQSIRCLNDAIVHPVIAAYRPSGVPAAIEHLSPGDYVNSQIVKRQKQVGTTILGNSVSEDCTFWYNCFP